MQLFDLGNEAYNQGLYEKAKNFYVKVLDENLHSAELYFNLGNSYYKILLIAYLLNYLSPRRENLDLSLVKVFYYPDNHHPCLRLFRPFRLKKDSSL